MFLFFSYFAFEQNLWDLCFVFGVSGQASEKLGTIQYRDYMSQTRQRNDFN